MSAGPAPPPDQSVRDRALDPAGSFIVQAPAGSGKTGLLAQRLLALLCRAERPEEILAITFTRRAAGELRERVHEALQGASRAGPAPPEPFARRTLELARAVLERDRALGWRVTEQPGRLRVLTIDALCNQLARGLPWRSGIAGDVVPTQAPRPLYREAARQLVELLDDDAPWTGPVATLLRHLDGDLARFERMVVDMLARRDQWLRFLPPQGAGAGEADRELLEEALVRGVEAEVAALQAAVPPDRVAELAEVCAYAGEQAAVADGSPDVVAWVGARGLPGADPAGLARWRALARVLQTEKGLWRARFTVKQGFPPARAGPGKIMKDRAAALAGALRPHEALRRRLARCVRLPEPAYSDDQWRVLAGLLQALRVAAGLLTVVFAERRVVDYVELSLAARRALEDEGAPTELALALDHRLRHVLVDEYQDTSRAQYELLARLTEGWEPGDGRTMFLVGDPMQSIYRFREADVALFLHTWREGLPQVPLEPLRLAANFRSGAPVVAWVNRTFGQVLPSRDDPGVGAVGYAPFEAVHAGSAADGVRLHALGSSEPGSEAALVCELARAARAADPEGSVAVLARTRRHLAALLPALRAAGLRYRGVELERLASVPTVQDLMALTRALMHPADRIAWLAVLRAPWCGLTLTDLFALVGDDPECEIAARLGDPGFRAALSEDGRRRAERAWAVLEAARARGGRMGLRPWVETTWLALGGAECVTCAEREIAGDYLRLLEVLSASGHRPDLAEIEERTVELYARAERPDADLEVMTIHRAKGLEFDTVIVPGLHRGQRAEQRRLLVWSRGVAGGDGLSMLLAPLPAAGEAGRASVYDFVHDLEARRAREEQDRLLYVAVTRARRVLHLIGHAAPDASGRPRPPAAGTLLASLWPVVSDQFGIVAAPAASAPAADAGPGAAAPETSLLRRLPGAWSPGEETRAAAGHLAEGSGNAAQAVEFDWAGEIARHVGNLVHEVLEQMAEEGLEAWDEDRLEARRPAWRRALAGLGVAPSGLDAGAETVRSALAGVLRDERARWLLDPGHRESRSEHALTGVSQGRLVRGVVDRTFVDERGTRWIVDYKSGRHEGGGLDAFLDREQTRYRAQLERYGSLFASLEDRPVRLALYFPLVGGWREWAYEGARPGD
jgi:ATP-dependent exoDNAse (exonuclease V) beta subunit